MKSISKVLDSSVYFLGRETEELEREFASFIGTKRAVCLSSGTAAEHLVLMSLGLSPNDRVLTTANTFISTADCIMHVNAKPDFVDINLENYTMSAPELRKKFKNDVKVVIPVHMYGHPTDMDEVSEVCAKQNALIIEDSCHAAGARYKSKRAGSLGHCAFFSFASKNITAGGDGGILTTNDENLAYTVSQLRDHGRDRKKAFFGHNMLGLNCRISEIGAAIARNQLRELDRWNSLRREHAKFYNESFGKIDDLVCPKEESWAYHVYLHYAVRTKRRDELRKYLESKGIETKVLYNPPIPMQPFYKSNAGEYPSTEVEKREVLCLPIRPNLGQEEMQLIADEVRNFFRS